MGVMAVQSRQRAVVRAVHVPYPRVAPSLQEKELDKFLVRGHLTRLGVCYRSANCNAELSTRLPGSCCGCRLVVPATQARIHLGRLWSSAITRKERHRLVDTGPYAFVRHPIYTGIITALVATAAIEATLAALVGATLICSGLWLKARAEGRFLMVELGRDNYKSYCRRVPMLIPFLWHR